jgi:hypothetical protein
MNWEMGIPNTFIGLSKIGYDSVRNKVPVAKL